MTTASDVPGGIRACWLSWIAVGTTEAAELVEHLGLTDVGEIAWSEGAELVDAHAHDADCFYSVVVTPAIRGWTLALGSWFSPTYLENVVHVTGLCKQLSSRFGRAQAFFHSEQRDGEAWLIAENGAVIRRFISEYPELALGEPFGMERRLLDAAGIAGKPEDLDPESDEAADWPYSVGCTAREIARESSFDPTSIGPDDVLVGPMLVGLAPEFELVDPLTGTVPYLGKSNLPKHPAQTL